VRLPVTGCLIQRLLRCATGATLLLALGFAAVLPGSASGQGTAGEPEALSREVQQIYERSRNSVARIEAQDANGALVGTGFFIDPSGTLVTSYSVGGESFNIVASFGESKYPARRLVADARSGIAILQLEKAAAATPFLPLGSSAELKVASPVVMVAYPLDLPLAPHFGMIAGFDGKYLDRYFVTTHIRADVPVKRGQGGAPLLNMKGEAVGVVISGVDEGAACYALPIEAVNKLHQDYIRFGEPSPGRLGLRVQPAGVASGAGSTAEVRQVDEGGPADEAGIRVGDVIEQIGTHPIRTPEDLLNACFYLTAGESLEMTVGRHGETITARLKAAERERPRKVPAKASRGLFDITLRPEAPSP